MFGTTFFADSRSNQGIGGIDQYTKLMLHMDDVGLTDSEITPKTPTLHGDVARSATQSKFGGFSAVFDGVGDYISFASDADFAAGTGDFTLELWAYLTNVTTLQILYDARGGVDGFRPTLYVTTGTVHYYFNSLDAIVGTFPLSINTWFHVALSRTGTSTKLFVNGTQDGATFSDSNTYTQGGVTIGADFSAAGPLTGYIDELRWSKGISRYSTNFTPPSSAFTT